MRPGYQMIGPCCGFQTGIFNVSFPEEGEESKLLCLLLHRQQPFSCTFTAMASFLPAPTTAREITIVTKEFRRHHVQLCQSSLKHFEFRAVVGRKGQHGVRSLLPCPHRMLEAPCGASLWYLQSPSTYSSLATRPIISLVIRSYLFSSLSFLFLLTFYDFFPKPNEFSIN